MKVLQLCHKPPQPAIDGGCIAINNITKGFLQNNISVKVLTISTKKHPFLPHKIDPHFLKETQIESAFVDTELNIVDAFSNLVTSDSYNISRFFSPDFDRLLRQTLKEETFDIIHLESLFMTTYLGTIKRLSKAKVILRSHNLEYMIWERLADSTTNKAKKIYLKILAKQLKRYELNIINQVDGIASITNEDGKKYKKMGCTRPIVTIPFGIDLVDYNHYTLPTDTSINLFHIGSMDWKPNLEGVAWFLEKVFPKLHHEFPNLKFHLAGRNMPHWLLENNNPSNIINHGEVDSAQQFIQQHQIMIVPLLSAGGMRIKIIEGMALGRVVLSTSIGAEGIDYTDRKNILIANKKNDFVKQLRWLMEQPERVTLIGQEARNLVESKYNNRKINQQLIHFYNQLL